MSSVSPSLAPFYGAVLADPAFLAAQDVFCYFELEEQDYLLFAERSATGQLRVYVLDALQSLYLLDLPQLVGSAQIPDFTPAQFQRLAPTWLNRSTSLASVGACVVHEDWDESGATVPDLPETAFAAALAAGATKATARWLIQLVKAAFLGDCFEYEARYTEAGLWLGPTRADETFITEKRQLQKLQALGLVTFASQRGQSGLTIQFNPAVLTPGIHWELAPNFFQTLLR